MTNTRMVKIKDTYSIRSLRGKVGILYPYRDVTYDVVFFEYGLHSSLEYIAEYDFEFLPLLEKGDFVKVVNYNEQYAKANHLLDEYANEYRGVLEKHRDFIKNNEGQILRVLGVSGSTFDGYIRYQVETKKGDDSYFIPEIALEPLKSKHAPPKVGDYIRIKTKEEMDATYNGKFTESILKWDTFKDDTCPISFEGHMKEYLGGTYKILSIVDNVGRREYNLSMDIDLRWLEDWLVELEFEQGEDEFEVGDKVKIKTIDEFTSMFKDMFMASIRNTGTYKESPSSQTITSGMLKLEGQEFEVVRIRNNNGRREYTLSTPARGWSWEGSWLARVEDTTLDLGKTVSEYQKSNAYLNMVGALMNDLQNNIPNYEGIIGFMLMKNGNILVMYRDNEGNSRTYIYEREGN